MTWRFAAFNDAVKSTPIYALLYTPVFVMVMQFKSKIFTLSNLSETKRGQQIDWKHLFFLIVFTVHRFYSIPSSPPCFLPFSDSVLPSCYLGLLCVNLKLKSSLCESHPARDRKQESFFLNLCFLGKTGDFYYLYTAPAWKPFYTVIVMGWFVCQHSCDSDSVNYKWCLMVWCNKRSWLKLLLYDFSTIISWHVWRCKVQKKWARVGNNSENSFGLFSSHLVILSPKPTSHDCVVCSVFLFFFFKIHN